MAPAARPELPLIAADSHAPARRVGWRFILVHALAYGGTWVALLLAPAILVLSGGNYIWLFLAVGAIVLAGSVAILPLKFVR